MKRLGPLVDRLFKSSTETRLESLIKAELPVATNRFLTDAVSEFHGQFYEECKTNEANLREQVDEGTIEVRAATNECSEEILELAQQYMDDLKDQSNQLEVSAEEN